MPTFECSRNLSQWMLGFNWLKTNNHLRRYEPVLYVNVFLGPYTVILKFK